MDDQQLTASEAFEESKARAVIRMAKLRGEIMRINDRAGTSPDWGDVGDLNAIAEALRDITENR